MAPVTLASGALRTAKPFGCSVCGARFCLHNALMCHLRRHSGEKTYKCAQCPLAFRQSAVLKEHLLKVHGVKTASGGMGLRRRGGFQCIVCGLRMRHQNHLNEHMNSHMIQVPLELPKDPEDEAEPWEEEHEIEYPEVEEDNGQKNGSGVSILKTEMIRLSPEMREEGGKGAPEVIQLDDDDDENQEDSDGRPEMEDVGYLEEPPAILEIFDDEDEDDREEELKSVKAEEETKQCSEEAVPLKVITSLPKMPTCRHCGHTFGNFGALGFHLKMKHSRKSRDRKMSK